MLQSLYTDMNVLASAEKAKQAARFFKTAPGEYGAGDTFIGLTVPESRTIAKKYSTLSQSYLTTLLNSPIHEHRLVALVILVERFKKATDSEQQKIVDYYLEHTSNINNWDLVDMSADKIVGNYLLDKDRAILHTLAHSKSLWERRIAIIATFAFIGHNQFEDTFKIAKILLQDKHDLIHKAVGWMLREVGKRNLAAEEKFLQQYYLNMPRTMLRYAIEQFPPQKRMRYMKK